MKNVIEVTRKGRNSCLVSIMIDRATNKYCYVNLTSQHICQCRFDSFEEALADLLKRDEVTSYTFIKEGDISFNDWSKHNHCAEVVTILGRGESSL